MDQIKIGKFIAQRRKLKDLTQMQLAEKLNITDRAISKWENGRSLPDCSIMLQLCSELEITVNDLLHGEVVKMENYKENSEQLLLEMVKQKEESDKLLLKMENVIGVISIIFLLTLCFLASFLNMEDWLRIVLIVLGFVVSFPGCFYALRLEQIAGYYECQHCHHKYVPTYKNVFLAMHVGRTRYMKCPECHEKSWQKKVISKK